MKKYSNFNNKSNKSIKLLSPLLFFLIIILTLATTFIIKTKCNEKNNIISEQTIAEHQNNRDIQETIKENKKSDETKIETDQTKKYIMPVSGEILVEFSDNKLIYNKTTKDWRRHDGTDISVNYGGMIKSMNDGKIIDIKTDILKGNIITIEYNDKIIVSYCNIDICDGLNIGEDVTQGMLIGYISTNPPFESEQDLHLHMEILNNNILSDLDVLDLK